MTPLHLDILLNYYVTSEDYELIGANATRSEYAYDLALKGYLYTPLSGSAFAITEHGKEAVERILEFSESLHGGL